LARIRSLKPEYWADQKLVRCCRDARLLYIALWNFADEQARMVGDPRQVKGLCFALDDDLTASDIDRLLGELASLGRVVRYEVDGERYLHLPKLASHQRLDERQPSRYPPPPEHAPAPENPPPPAPTDFPGEVRGDSTQVNGDPGEVSARARGHTRALQVAGSKEQVAGSKETPLVVLDEPARPVAVHPSTEVHDVFAAWKATLPPGDRHELTDVRRDAIRQARKRYPFEDVRDAVQGWVNDPWPERAQQNDIGQLLWMGTKRKPQNVLEKMRDLFRRGPPVQPGKRTRELVNHQQGMRAVGMAKGVIGNGNGVAPMGTPRSSDQRELARPADRTVDSG